MGRALRFHLCCRFLYVTLPSVALSWSVETVHTCICVHTWHLHVHSRMARVRASPSHHSLISCHLSSRSRSRVVERPSRPPPSERTLTGKMAHSSLPCSFIALLANCQSLRHCHPLHMLRHLVTLPPLVASHLVASRLVAARLLESSLLAERHHPARLLASSTSPPLCSYPLDM